MSSKCVNCTREQQPNEKMKKCGDCYEVSYCSVGCQFKHWELHKPDCVKKGPECPICYEVILKRINKTITECGHVFHSTCIIQHVLLNNIACPLCRDPLADIQDDEPDEED